VSRALNDYPDQLASTKEARVKKPRDRLPIKRRRCGSYWVQSKACDKRRLFQDHRHAISRHHSFEGSWPDTSDKRCKQKAFLCKWWQLDTAQQEYSEFFENALSQAGDQRRISCSFALGSRPKVHRLLKAQRAFLGCVTDAPNGQRNLRVGFG